MESDLKDQNDLTDHEKEAVDELRHRMKGDMEPDMYDDVYFILRFLRARDYNIDNAETMLRKHLQWREKYDMKNVFKLRGSDITDFLEKYFPYPFIGHDKEGCVIRFCNVGTMDITGVTASLKFEDIAKVIVYEIERETEKLQEQSKKLGRNVDRCVYIYNMEHFSFLQATDKKTLYVLMFLMNLFVNNYPERLKAAFVVNAPIYFNFMYAVLKNVVPKKVLSKILVYSDDSYKEDLLKMIDADVLPAFLCGNRTDPDGNPLCLTFINRGEPVPKSCYLNKNKQPLSKAPGVQKVTLSKAAFHEVSLEVKETGSYLEWEFETKCRDIGFGLFYQEIIDGEEKNTELVPIQRIDTELCPEIGTFLCEVPGTYVIVFDNTYSWVRAKEIYFRTKLITPKEHELDLNKETNEESACIKSDLPEIQE